MQRLTGKQSRMARGLLKWNIYDLANRAKGVVAKRIDSFEHGMVHLVAWEGDELMRTFKKAGVVFKADFEVALEKDEGDNGGQPGGMHGEGGRVVLSSDNSVISDSSSEQAIVDSVFPPEGDLAKKKRAESG